MGSPTELTVVTPCCPEIIEMRGQIVLFESMQRCVIGHRPYVIERQMGIDQIGQHPTTGHVVIRLPRKGSGKTSTTPGTGKSRTSRL